MDDRTVSMVGHALDVADVPHVLDGVVVTARELARAWQEQGVGSDAWDDLGDLGRALVIIEADRWLSALARVRQAH